MKMPEERGAAALETLGLLGLLFTAALFALQLQLLASSAVAAVTAARTGWRVLCRGGDPTSAAIESLPRDLRPGARVSVRDGSIGVTVLVPLAVPGFDTEALRVTRSAEFPDCRKA